MKDGKLKILTNPYTIRGKRIYLKRMSVEDITPRYINWLNDPEVTRFLSCRGILQTRDMVKNYVQSYENDNGKLLLGIFIKETGLHIGNITFSSIDLKNDTGSIGIAIGDKSFWGKGYAREALSLAVDYSFNILKLHRLQACMSAANPSSKKLFENAGFKYEGSLKEREKFDDAYADDLMYGLLNKQEFTTGK